MIMGLLSNAKLSENDISNKLSEKSPLPIPGAVVQGLLDQLVAQGKIQKTEENGETYYHM